MAAVSDKAYVPNSAFFSGDLAETDPDLSAAVQAELRRQQEKIELIASENIVSRAVLTAQGSVLTNKYAEGYPGRRYYGGCEYVDVAETLAIERACKLFDCSFANVQPHSGAQANQAVFFALLQPGDTFMGLNLSSGRPFDPRLAGQPVGQVVQGRAVQRSAPGPSDRHGRGRDPGEAAQAQADRRRRVGLSPDHRLRRLPQDRGLRRRLSHGGHGALCRACGGRRASQSAGPLPYRDHDDAQDAARPARRHDPFARPGARQEDQLGRLSRVCRAAP